MNSAKVASLHLHPASPGERLTAVDNIEVVAGKGILGEPRYFGRIKSSGEPSLRQVTLMEREQIAEHAQALGLKEIPPGAVRANIETTGIELVALKGREIQIGEAVLLLYAPRDPCEKMDAICRGLRERMMNDRQGMLAQVIQPGVIRVGDEIRVLTARQS
ncbi:MAG: MOSC domain-containing protein [Verrucomicrobia bacterium]|nr:MAG: MOSC domain-containing protein [Verrucomicrobiota bacterium]